MHGSKVLVDSIATKNHNRVGTYSYLVLTEPVIINFFHYKIFQAT